MVEIHLPAQQEAVTPQSFTFALNRDKLRTVRRREGSYLLRSNLTREPPAQLWQYYIQLTEIEQAFKELKGDLSIRPIYHQIDSRVEAHIFVAFMAYCLQVTRKTTTPGVGARADSQGRPGEVCRAANGGRAFAYHRCTLLHPATLHAA